MLKTVIPLEPSSVVLPRSVNFSDTGPTPSIGNASTLPSMVGAYGANASLIDPTGKTDPKGKSLEQLSPQDVLQPYSLADAVRAETSQPAPKEEVGEFTQLVTDIVLETEQLLGRSPSLSYHLKACLKTLFHQANLYDPNEKNEDSRNGHQLAKDKLSELASKYEPAARFIEELKRLKPSYLLEVP